MQKIQSHLGMFIIGLSDSVSLYWIRKILLVTHPSNKKIHPASLQLLVTFKNTFIQVFVFLIGLPFLFRYFQQEFIASLLSTFFLLLTFGYLFFYNTEVMSTTKKVALWSAKFPNTNFCQFDNREKVQLFYSLSNQVKGFIFLLLYYTPIFLSCLVIISYFPTIGTILLCISESFFNSAFYFLKKWPYDRYNVAFIQKNLFYMLGYGFFVSFVCNVCLTGDFSRGAYFIISQWMIINCLLHSPPQIQLKSISQAIKYATSVDNRSKLANAYNIFRKNIRKDKAYRSKVVSDIKILKPALLITQYLNSVLARSLGEQITSSISIQTQYQPQSQTLQAQNLASTSVETQQKSTKNLYVVSEVYEPEDEFAIDKKDQK